MMNSNALAENIIIFRNLLTGGFLNSAGFGFIVYIFTICYPGIAASPAMLMNLRMGFMTMADAGEGSLYIAVPSLLFGLLIFSRHGAFSAIYQAQAFLVFLFVFSSFVLFLLLIKSDYLGSESQMVQYITTVGCFLLCLCFWQAPARYVDNAIAMAFLALITALVTAAIIQGFHHYRWVGLIHPNHYARYAYVALILHSILTKRVSLFIFLPCLMATYMVSARTVMVGMILFYLGYIFCAHYNALTSRIQQVTNLRIIATFLISFPIAIAIISLFIDGDRVIEIISNDLAIFDPDRGVGSGFTGRSESWNRFFDAVDQFIFVGYGFRSSRYALHTVHSGVLSYFMDFGLILGSILLIAIVARAVYLIWLGFKYDEQRALISGLAISTTLIIQCFEPDNFNIGFIGSFFFMLILAYVIPVHLQHSKRKLSLRSKIQSQIPMGRVQSNPQM